MVYYGMCFLYALTLLTTPEMTLHSAYTGAGIAVSQQATEPENPKQGPFMAKPSMRLTMAMGERESFQVGLRGGEADIEAARLQVSSSDTDAPAATVYQVGMLQREPRYRSAFSPEAMDGLVADILAPQTPISLAPEETLRFWVAFKTTQDSRPGEYRYTVALRSGDQEIVSQRVVLEVQDFLLSDTPAFPIIGDLHRETLTRFYGLNPHQSAAWRPFYQQIAAYDVTPSLADRQVLEETRPPDSSLLEAHLELLLETGHPAYLEVGGAQGSLVQALYASNAETPEQYLAGYLSDLEAWRNAQDGVVPEFLLRLPPIPISPTGWAERYALYKYCFEDAAAYNPLVQGSIHPFFHFVLRHWAAPFSRYQPELMARLREGASLRNIREYPPYTWQADAPKAPEALEQTHYTNAFDGSPFTVWDTGFEPTPESPLRLTFRFDRLLHSEEIRILWEGPNYAEDIAVYTAADGEHYTPATVKWSHEEPVENNEKGVSTGVFRYANNFKGIQLVLQDSAYPAPLKMALITFQGEDEAEADGLAPPVQPWLEVDYHQFPALAPGRHPAEPRLIPWVGWGHGYTGVLLHALNHWPPDWPRITDHHAVLWQAPGPWQHFLFYPGETGLLPSIRLERLRDGMEDLAYLKALEDAVERGLVESEAARAVLGRPKFPMQPDADTLSYLLSWVEGQRSRAAALLHEVRYRPDTE